MKHEKTILLFHVSSAAIYASRKLKSAGIECKLSSIPRDIGSDCGYCVIVDRDKGIISQDILIESEIDFDRIVDYDFEG